MTHAVAPSAASGDRTRLVAAFVAVSLLWGSTYLGIRISLESFPPFLLSGMRFVTAGAVLWAMARARGEPTPSGPQWRSAFVTGGLLFVVGNGFVNFAEQSVSSGLVSVLVATMPLWATVLGRLFGAAATPRELVGVGLGLVGVAVLELGGELRASPVGAACALLAPIGWALGSLLSRRMPLPAGTMMRTAAQMLAGGVATTAAGLALGEHLPAAPTVRSVAAAIYLLVFGSLVGFTAYGYLLAHTRPAVATSYAYVNPVIAVFLGVALAGESFGATSAVGAVLVLAAVAVVNLGRASALQSRESASLSRSIVEVASASAAKSSTGPDSPTTT